MIYTASGCLGIEHRQLFLPNEEHTQPLQALESRIDEILAIAQEHVELRGMPPVHATFFFDHHHIRGLNKKQRLELGRAIARAVYMNLPGENENKVFEYWQGREAGIPEEVDVLLLSRSEHQTRHDWSSSEGGMVLTDCQFAIQKAINEKAEKLPVYQQSCQECWLLIVADGLKPSSFVHLNESSRDYVYKSPFDRTYFLACAYSKVFMLKTTKRCGAW